MPELQWWTLQEQNCWCLQIDLILCRSTSLLKFWVKWSLWYSLRVLLLFQKATIVITRVAHFLNFIYIYIYIYLYIYRYIYIHIQFTCKFHLIYLNIYDIYTYDVDVYYICTSDTYMRYIIYIYTRNANFKCVRTNIHE